MSDSWAYSITRTAPVTLTRVNKATIQATANQNLPVTINLNTAGATSSNTVLAGPSNGTTVWSGSDIVYTPSSDFLGKDGFSFAVNNAGTLSVGYVEITVNSSVPSGKVSYRGNGSEAGTVPIDANSYAQNTTVTVAGNTGNLTRVGYNFAGWNTAASGTGTNYNAGSTFLMGASGMILYAKWTAVPTYTVTYLGNANNTGTEPWPQIKTSNVNLTLATNTGVLGKTGYNFVGWNTAANGTGVDYAVGATYSGNANLTLYAKWTPRTFTLTFNSNGGGTPSMANKIVTYNSTYGELATVARDGYAFVGWFTTNAATGGTQILSSSNVTITGNTTVYARWAVATTYTVSYGANGATGGTVPVDQTKVQDVTLSLATNSGGLVRAGYTFSGWNTAANGSGNPYAAGGNYTANAGVTLYAQWAGVATYTVSYHGNGSAGGAVPSNQTKTQGVSLTLATNTGNLTKIGFSFAGWNTAANGSGTAYASGGTYATDAAVTLYARWNALPVIYAGADQTIYLAQDGIWTPAAASTAAWYDATRATINAGTVSITNAGTGGGTISGPASLASNGIGNLQAVQFNGSNQQLTGDFTNTGNTLTAFFVGKSSSSTQVAYAGMMSVWADAQASDWNNVGSAVLFNQNNTTANSIQSYRSSALSSATGTLTNGFVATTVFSGSTNTMFLNGAAANVANTTGNFNTGKIVVGSRRENSTFSKRWNGIFGEAIICNAFLSNADRQKIEGYLAHKWNLATSLVTGHPYKNTAPQGEGTIVTLDGTVTDADALTSTWTVVSGPAAVTFANASSIDTSATFTVAGTYVLRLTANDGYGQVTDDLTIVVNPPLPAVYTGWSGGSFANSFTSVGITENQDGDQMDNLMEFAFGTDPTVQDGGSMTIDGSAHGQPMPVREAGNVMSYYFVRRDDHGTSGSVSYTVQFSSDLVNFYNSVITPTFVSDSGVDSGYEVVKVEFPSILPDGKKARFARLGVDVIE